MIEKLIDYCARNRALVLVLTAFAVAMGLWAARRVPLDAIPDLSDTQVIVYSRWDRSPDIVEDQVTYPVVTALLGTPKVKAVRGFSDFGFSYVYVIFEDGTDLYWARSRVLEYLSKILPRLPEGVKTELGPDATGVGWVFQYALVDRTGRHDLAQLRSFQDWTLRYWLQAVPGVSEVASIGGFQKQYQVQLNPNALAARNVPLMAVAEALRRGNNDVGARLVEIAGAEYMVRGKGYLRSKEDVENTVVTRDMRGTPVLVKNLGTVVLGPDIRRGVSDLDGEGDAVGGIVVMRSGENALNVIRRVKAKLKEVEPSLPEGMEVVTVYDRSGLILQAIATIKEALTAEMLIVSLVIILFLWHFPSALLPILTLPVATVLGFLPMLWMKVTSSVMSLGGIAVAVGDMVDASIVMADNVHKRLEESDKGTAREDRKEVIIRAMKEVGPSAFYSLMIMAVAFLPIFALTGQAGRMFKPLAVTKNLALALAAVLAITLTPAVRMLFTRREPFTFRPAWFASLATWLFVGKMYAEADHPLSRPLHRWYEPVVRGVLVKRRWVVGGALALVLATVPAYLKLGHEFMPPLEEGSILFMPTTLPGLSVTEAFKLMHVQDKILKSFPEVERVFGKAGRAETPTDPAPFSMMETTVLLKPRDQWRPVKRWYSWMPGLFKRPFQLLWPDRITYNQLIEEMDKALKLPGVVNAWTMPVKNRIDMLSTGVRTPVGIKVLGPDLKVIEETGAHLEAILREVKGTRSVFAERTAGGYFLDAELRRDRLARHGLSVEEAQMALMTAVGGEPVTTTIEGRERYTVSVRYARDYRETVQAMKRVLVTTMAGAHIPLSELADIRLSEGPSMIRNENGLLAGYVYVDVADRDVGSYVADAKEAVREKLKLPAGYSLLWSGQYEFMEEAWRRLLLIMPLTLFIIVMLLRMSTKSWMKTVIVLLAVPFSAVGAVWLLWILDYNLSTAVYAGIVALLGLDAETGVFMLLYLDMSYEDRVKSGRMKTEADLTEAVVHGAVQRLRPKVMTVATNFLGFMPILWATGTGSDMMKRLTAPMVGGLATSFLLELLVYPAVFYMWKRRSLPRPSPGRFS